MPLFKNTGKILTGMYYGLAMNTKIQNMNASSMFAPICRILPYSHGLDGYVYLTTNVAAHTIPIAFQLEKLFVDHTFLMNKIPLKEISDVMSKLYCVKPLNMITTSHI